MVSRLKELSKTKSHLIFDFDKTIAQIEIDWSDWHRGVSEIYAKYDPNHGYEVGKNPHEYYNRLALKHGNTLVAEIKKYVSSFEQENTVGFTPYSELVDYIKINDTNTLFVFSSNSLNTVNTGLSELGIVDKFETIVTRDDVSTVKPEAEGFSLFEGLENNKEKYLMIGDSDADEYAAKSIGIDFLKCTYFGTYLFSKEHGE